MGKNETKNVLKKIIWFFVFLLIALIIAASTYSIFFARDHLKKILSETVYEKSGNSYQLDIETLQIKLLKRSVALSGVFFHSIKGFERGSTNQIDNMGASSIKLSGIRVVPLIFRSELIARKLWIDEPGIELFSDKSIDLELFSSKKIVKGDPLTIPVLKEICIDSIIVVNARLTIDTLLESIVHAPSLKLVVNDFRTGGIKQTDTPFPFDVSDISLKLENLSGKLSDEVHQIEAGEISFSLLHSILTAKNVLLTPYADGTFSTDNQYRISIPLVEIKSDNLDQLIQSDTLSIQSVMFEKPVISIQYGSKVVKGTPLNEINFYTLLQGKLKRLSVNHFSIQNADLKLYPPLSQQPDQHLENLFIKFYNMVIDSGSYKNRERILSAEDLNISLERYTIFHSDNIHRFVMEKLKADSRNRKISTGHVSFEPIQPGLIGSNETLLDFHSSGIVFKGINLKAFYHDKILPMEELVVRSPEARIRFKEEKAKKSGNRNPNLLLAKTSDYLKGIYVNKTIIERGIIHYSDISSEQKSGFFTAIFQFELDNLSLDNATFYKTDKLFFADRFKAWFSNLSVQLSDDLHRVLIDSAYVSSSNRTADILNFRIQPVKTGSFSDSTKKIVQPEIYDLRFPRIYLTGADLHRAFFRKELIVSGITIDDPYLNVETLREFEAKGGNQFDPYALLSGFLQKIEIRKLTMNNGNLNLVQYRKGKNPIDISNQFTIQMSGFLLDSLSGKRSNKILYSDDIDLVLTGQSFTLDDGVHRLSADEIGILTSTDRIYLTNARLFPNVDAPAFQKLPVAVIATIPSLEFTGADINGLLKNGNFFTNTILISNPDIQFLIKPGKDSISDKKQPLTIKGLSSVWANQVKMNKGYVELSHYENNKSKSFASGYFSLSLNNLKADSGQETPTLKYTNFTLDVENGRFNLPDKVHQLTLGEAKYDLAKMNFSFKDMDIRPDRGVAKDQPVTYLNLFFPDGNLSGFDIRKLFEEKRLTAFTLTLNQPDLEIKSNSSKPKKKFDPYNLQLSKTLQPFVEMVHIGQIVVKKGKLTLVKQKPADIRNISLTANNFLINKFSEQKEKFLYCDHISFEVEHFMDKTSDGFYYYSIDKINLNDKGDFRLTGISLTPAYTEAEFNRKKVYQDDCITIEKAECAGKNLDLKHLFRNNEMKISNAKFQFGRVEFYRNSKYPFPDNFVIEMPQKLLRDVKFRFCLDSANLFCNRLDYRELEPHATNETRVHFTDIHSNLFNVTNLPAKLKNNPIVRLTLTGKLMGFGNMKAGMEMNIADTRNLFTVKAECDKIPFYLLNSVTEPGLLISMKDGYNQKIELYFEANKDSSTGWMKFAYNDLMISVLSERSGQMKEDKFISFLANALAVKRDNPVPGRIIEPVYFQAYPDRRKSIVNYIWLSAFEGIKKTLGMKENSP